MALIDKGYDYQEKAIEDAFEAWKTNKNICLVAPTGAGKCLGRDTPVLMFDGSIKMVQDVKPNDRLMGPDSKVRNVKSVCTGKEMLYRVTPVKGDPYIVNESHILSLKKTRLRKTPRYPCENVNKGEIVNIPVSEYMNKSKYFKHIHKGWRTGVEFETKTLPDVLPPYLLGLWLGDGTTDHPAITTADVEVVEYLKFYCFWNDFGLSENDHINNKSSTYRITNKKKRLTGLIPQMRNYGLLGYKHVPTDYKINSREIRLEVLAGVIDSDGHLSKGCYDLVFKSEQLSNDVVFIARSLGFACYIKPCKKTCTNTGAVGDYFRLSISGDVSQIPTRLVRHQPETRQQIKDVLVTGITVEPIGVGDYFGFDIDGDRLFLLGDFTVTHNTLIKSLTAKYYIKDNHDKLVIIFAHRDVLLSQISLAVGKVGLPHRLLCSKVTEREIGNFHMSELGESFITDKSNIIVASVPTWVRRQTEAIEPKVGLWLMDECFTPSAIIDGKSIRDIEVGDYVTAFNESTMTYEKREVVRKFKNVQPENMVRLIVIGGNPLHCTLGHPFYTKQGWVEAGNLDLWDEVLYFGNWTRLASLSVYKSGDNEYTSESQSDGYVYNIEVEGLHTYVANNITVHNCHHLLRENMWGKCVEPMVNALGMGVTATPCRADGKGLGKHASGVFETIIETPGMGELIARKRLSPYKVYTIPNDIDLSGVNTTSSGDYNQKLLDGATRKSHITGDSVAHYKRLADGKQAIIFAASVAHATQVAEEFRAAGYSAVALSSKSHITERQNEISKFKASRTQILVNYDLFGEGFDVPAVEVVIMLRKTLSYGLFKQMFGRCLRVFDGKLYGILIDHVGNVIEHQIPGKHLHDDPEWSLDDAQPKGKSDAGELMLNRTCPECFNYYRPASNTINDFVCPACAHAETKKERSAALHDIQVMDCELVEYDTGFLTEVFKEIKKVDTPLEVFKNKMNNAPNVVKYSAIKNHEQRQVSQKKLRYWIGHWCDTVNKHLQVNEDTIRNEFHRIFNVDVYTAQTLSSREASELCEKIKEGLFDILFCKVI